MKKAFLLIVLLLSVGQVAVARPLKSVKPLSVGVDPVRMRYADEAINKSIAEGETPGAVLAVVRAGKLAYLKAYGNRQVVPDTVMMTVNTVFDMASVSKVASTAIATMILIERGQLRLQDNVSLFLPDFQPWVDTLSGKKRSVKVVDLLTHTSGLTPYVSVSEFQKTHAVPDPKGLMKYIGSMRRNAEPGTVFDYSCLNMITLQNIIENISGVTLDEFTEKNIFRPLAMKNTGYIPQGEMLAMTAPTQVSAGNVPLVGVVHDPMAQVLNGGVSGNAGLFSNAADMATLAAMLLNGGEINGVRFLSPLTVRAMRSIPEGYEKFGRSLGWDVFSSFASNQGDLLGGNTYGHTGYTGTSIIIDPDSDVAIILLTNRVHPYDKTSVVRLRALVANAVAGAIVKL